MTPFAAIELIIRSLNVWLTLTGRKAHISPGDVVMTERAGVIFLAFRVAEEEAQP